MITKQQVRCLFGKHDWLYSDYIQNSIYDIGVEARCAVCGALGRRPSIEAKHAYRSRGESAFFPELRRHEAAGEGK